MISLRDIVRHPLTIAGSVFTVLAHAVQFAPLDIVAAVLWTNLPSLFTVLSISAFTIAPNTPLPKQPLVVGAILIGAAYAGKLAWNIFTDLQERL